MKQALSESARQRGFGKSLLHVSHFSVAVPVGRCATAVPIGSSAAIVPIGGFSLSISNGHLRRGPATLPARNSHPPPWRRAGGNGLRFLRAWRWCLFCCCFC